MQTPVGYWVALGDNGWQTFHWTDEQTWPTTDDTGYTALAGPYEREDAQDRAKSLNVIFGYR